MSSYYIIKVNKNDVIQWFYSQIYFINGQFVVILIKDTDIQNEISQTIDKYNRESFSTRSQIGQIALIQSKVFKEAVYIMGGTISNMYIEIEEKDKK